MSSLDGLPLYRRRSFIARPHLCSLRHTLKIRTPEGFISTAVHGWPRHRLTRSGKGFIEQLQNHYEQSAGQIASLSSGSYYAMDRDKRWARVKVAYDLLVEGKGKQAKDMVAAMRESYDNDETDGFIKPINNANFDGNLHYRGRRWWIFFNYRSDRAKELTVVLTQHDMPEEGIYTIPGLQYCS